MGSAAFNPKLNAGVLAAAGEAATPLGPNPKLKAGAAVPDQKLKAGAAGPDPKLKAGAAVPKTKEGGVDKPASAAAGGAGTCAGEPKEKENAAAAATAFGAVATTLEGAAVTQDRQRV